MKAMLVSVVGTSEETGIPRHASCSLALPLTEGLEMVRFGSLEK